MTSKIGREAAFPRARTSFGLGHLGMTYRQWLIGMALQGLHLPADYSSGPSDTIAARRAIALADALLAELAKEEGR